ncbi:hypothetical protein AGR2A_Cc80025 [Agrobacterium genomosp. 2 str. CFBP 5494]|uniref:Uncharacterized protein n=1 Tax=Agrobacterium genomosp. 2 str. CFBP 5494 TaxID=1183436 RepID=A0A9W5F126_9HYPH|nr:hypothetical protein AGR2A_Cc80025 [Agrobacterium genomosp. 2 str. CFBP 5494]
MKDESMVMTGAGVLDEIAGPNPHTVTPAPEPGSSVVKSLTTKDFFHGADAPWLDAGSSPA